ncbi:MAG: rod shape-determining protein MreD [Paracoccaceae bacterium]
MVDPLTTSRLAHRALYLGLVATVIFVRILPLGSIPSRWPGPDLILCLTFVWLLRRPDYVPAFMVAVVFFSEDLIAMRPPGLWTALVLAGTEFLRTRETNFRDMPLLLEWLTTSAVIMLLSLLNWAILALFMVPHGSFGMTILQALSTIAIYPLVVAASLFLFGLRKAATGEVDALGHRL